MSIASVLRIEGLFKPRQGAKVTDIPTIREEDVTCSQVWEGVQRIRQLLITIEVEKNRISFEEGSRLVVEIDKLVESRRNIS